jgi:hypothetical protein
MYEMCVRVCASVCTCANGVCVCICMYNIHIHMLYEKICIYIYICMYVCMYDQIQTNVYMIMNLPTQTCKHYLFCNCVSCMKKVVLHA